MIPNRPKFHPIIPVRWPDIFGWPDIFDSSDWVYELRYDGFRLSPILMRAAVDSYLAKETK
jgi:hypothetical protein